MALPSMLKGLPDMERGITRIFHRTANPAEFVQVLQALVNIAPQLGMQVSMLVALQGVGGQAYVYLCDCAACAVFRLLIYEVYCCQHFPCTLLQGSLHHYFCNEMCNALRKSPSWETGVTGICFVLFDFRLDLSS